MANGYTAPIEEDDTFTLAKYIWRCAKAFGFWGDAHMRDSSKSWDDPLPLHFKTNDSLLEDIGMARDRLEKVKAMTDEEAEAAATYVFELWRESYGEPSAELVERASRYENMQKQVEAWTPPTPEHEGLKRFMLEQIEEERPTLTPTKPFKQTGEQYKAQEIDDAREMLEQAQKRWARHVANITHANVWLQTLNEQIPQEL